MAIRTSGIKGYSSRRSGSRRSELRFESLETRCMLAATVELPALVSVGPDPVCVYSSLQLIADTSAVVGPHRACSDKSSSDTEGRVAGDSANLREVTVDGDIDCGPVTVEQEAVAVCDIVPTESTAEGDGTVAELVIEPGNESAEAATQVIVPANESPELSDVPIVDGTSIERNEELVMVWDGGESQPVEADDIAPGGLPESTVGLPNHPADEGDGPIEAVDPSIEKPVIFAVGGDAVNNGPATTESSANTSTTSAPVAGIGIGGPHPFASPQVGRNRLVGRSFEEVIQEMIAPINTRTDPMMPIGAPGEYLTIDIVFTQFNGGLFKRPMRLRSGVNR